MTKTIAIAGKGGTGKTSIAALLIKLLSENGTVLAIDGDPSSNLHMALGLPLEETIGSIREGMLDRKAVERTGIPKPEYLELKIREALVESKGIDLLAMGRPEGPGCYCAANNWLRNSIDRLASHYEYVVIDNEAGMEHISRQTARAVDILLIISDPSIRGITAAARMKDLIGELRSHVDRICLVVNRVRSGIPPQIRQAIDNSGLDLIAAISEDPYILDLEVSGKPLIDLLDDSPLCQGVTSMATKLNLISAKG
jgi:CO dehydrogenase maturation factor